MVLTSSPSDRRRPRSRADVCSLLGLTRPLGTIPVAQVGPQEPGSVAPDDVVLRRVVLTPPGGQDVPCLYLAPPGDGPWPGVVAVHQHNGEYGLGKSEPAGLRGDPSMAYGLAMARLGAATVVPDLWGFEERTGSGTDRPAENREAARLERAGTSLQARHVEDVALCLTWLASRPEVAGELGMVGHSLGGQVTFFAAACDPRVRAAVISCGVGTIESFDRAGVEHNAAWYVPGIREAGDTPAVAAVVSGQRLWVTAGSRDALFPMAGVRQVVEAFGEPTAQLTVFDGEHAFPPDLSLRSLAWLASSLGALRSTDGEP